MCDENGNDREDTSGYEMLGVRLARLRLEDLVSVSLPPGLGLVPAVPGMVS